MLQQTEFTPESVAADIPDQLCEACGGARLRPDRIRTSFWHGERLVVVEEIPALVCDACGERFYDDATVTALDLLRGRGFPPGEARATIEATVFTLDAVRGRGGGDAP